MRERNKFIESLHDTLTNKECEKTDQFISIRRTVKFISGVAFWSFEFSSVNGCHKRALLGF